MTNLEFILEHGSLMIDHAILPALFERDLNLDDEEGDMKKAFEALGLVEEMAYKSGSGEIEFDIQSFLTVYPEYSNVAWNVYNDAKQDKVASDYKKSLKQAATGRKGMTTVYCPCGHNQTTVDASYPWDDCAACGKIMTERAEEEYYSVLIACGQVG